MTGIDQSTPTTSPCASITVRRVEPITGVVITVSGDITADGAAELSRCLRAELDADPGLVVVDLAGMSSCDASGLRVLTLASERALSAGIVLHLLDRGQPAPRQLLVDAGLA